MKKYQYKGSNYCGFCQNNKVFSRWHCQVNAECKIDLYWCEEKSCGKNATYFLNLHNREHHTPIDIV